jgi:hypothetical protein
MGPGSAPLIARNGFVSSVVLFVGWRSIPIGKKHLWKFA